jgi:hypothetical protein
MPPGATMLEAFADFRDWRSRSTKDEARALPRPIPEGEVLKFLKDPNTSKGGSQSRVRLFHAGGISDAPDVAGIDVPGRQRGRARPDRRDCNPASAVVSRRQLRCLFDGVSNLSLTGKIAHFELGYIPGSAKELRAAAGFLITNHARKHIITLPRALRKRNVYEEVARFLDIPGGEEIVKESYAQLRKFNCWNISIVQQYARFKQSRIRSAVFGNSRQFF